MKSFHLLLALICSSCILSLYVSSDQYSNDLCADLLSHKVDCLDLFSPEDNIRNVLIDLIGKEKKHIKIAMYYLIDMQIIKALIRAAETNRVTIDVIVDPTCPPQNLEKLYYDANIYRYCIDKGIMHHKFILFSSLKILGEGSYNFTYSAQYKNRENFSFYHVERPDTLCARKYKQFETRFNTLLKQSLPYDPISFILAPQS